MQVYAAKTSCIHPDRPISKACADCPRRKGKGVAAEMAPVHAAQVRGSASVIVHSIEA
jgi:hypothetical protein